MRYRIMMSVVVDAANDQEALASAKKLSELLKSPMVQLAVAGEGIQLSGNGGNPVVHQPLPVNGMRA